MAKSASYYAVAKGRKPGVYRTWAECEAQVSGFSGAAYKKFPSAADAQKFVEGPTIAAYSYRPHVPAPALPVDDEAQGPSSKRRKIDNTVPQAEEGGSGSRHIRVYCDGAASGNGRKGAAAGWGVWFADEGPLSELNEARRLPGEAQTNNRGELMALIRAVQLAPKDCALTIMTDSQYSVHAIATWQHSWRKKGWTRSNGEPVQNRDLIRRLEKELRQRKIRPVLQYVKGHAGHYGNEMADRLAVHGATLPDVPREDWDDLEPSASESEDEGAHTSAASAAAAAWQKAGFRPEEAEARSLRSSPSTRVQPPPAREASQGTASQVAPEDLQASEEVLQQDFPIDIEFEPGLSEGHDSMSGNIESRSKLEPETQSLQSLTQTPSTGATSSSQDDESFDDKVAVRKWQVSQLQPPPLDQGTGGGGRPVSLPSPAVSTGQKFSLSHFSQLLDGATRRIEPTQRTILDSPLQRFRPLLPATPTASRQSESQATPSQPLEYSAIKTATQLLGPDICAPPTAAKRPLEEDAVPSPPAQQVPVRSPTPPPPQAPVHPMRSGIERLDRLLALPDTVSASGVPAGGGVEIIGPTASGKSKLALSLAIRTRIEAVIARKTRANSKKEDGTEQEASSWTDDVSSDVDYDQVLLIDCEGSLTEESLARCVTSEVEGSHAPEEQLASIIQEALEGIHLARATSLAELLGFIYLLLNVRPPHLPSPLPPLRLLSALVIDSISYHLRCPVDGPMERNARATGLSVIASLHARMSSASPRTRLLVTNQMTLKMYTPQGQLTNYRTRGSVARMVPQLEGAAARGDDYGSAAFGVTGAIHRNSPPAPSIGGPTRVSVRLSDDGEADGIVSSSNTSSCNGMVANSQHGQAHQLVPDGTHTARSGIMGPATQRVVLFRDGTSRWAQHVYPSRSDAWVPFAIDPCNGRLIDTGASAFS